VIAGEWDGTANQLGTMLTKIDYDGELLWSQVLQPANGNMIRNFDVIEYQGFIVVGDREEEEGIL